MPRMTESEWRAFLVERPRTGKLATVRRDGSPHVAPVWFDVDDDGTILFMTRTRSAKGHALRRDPRICLCVDDDEPPFSYVVVDGRVTWITEDPAEMLGWSTRIGGRYMGADQAEVYGRRNAVAGEMLVRVTPVHVAAERGVAD